MESFTARHKFHPPDLVPCRIRANNIGTGFWCCDWLYWCGNCGIVCWRLEVQVQYRCFHHIRSRLNSMTMLWRCVASGNRYSGSVGSLYFYDSALVVFNICSHLSDSFDWFRARIRAVQLESISPLYSLPLDIRLLRLGVPPLLQHHDLGTTFSGVSSLYWQTVASCRNDTWFDENREELISHLPSWIDPFQNSQRDKYVEPT